MRVIFVASLALFVVVLWCPAMAAPDPKPEKPAADAPGDAPEKPEPEGPAKPKPGEPAKPDAKPKPGEPAKPEAKEEPEPEAKPKPAIPAAKPVEKEAYVEMPVDESLRNSRSAVQRILNNGTMSAADQTLVTDYYTKFAIPAWTVIDKRAEVRKFRSDLINTQLKPAKEPAHTFAIGLVLPLLDAMAKGNHHPVARVNAMLAIGELNATEAPRPSDNPTPLADAQRILLASINDSAAAGAVRLPDSVKVAALVGIARHAELGALTGASLNRAVSELTKLATSEVAPGRSPAGHAWMRTMAVNTLATLKTPGPQGEVVTTLLAIVGDSGVPFSTRCAAARALGNLEYAGGAGQAAVVPGKMIQQMGQLAFDAASGEAKRHEKEKTPISRRRVQAHLIAVYNGLAGLAALASQPGDAALHGKVTGALKNCLGTLEDQDLKDDELATKLKEQLETLSKDLNAAPPAPAAAAKPESPEP
jgi:hypothetical protein